MELRVYIAGDARQRNLHRTSSVGLVDRCHPRPGFLSQRVRRFIRWRWANPYSPRVAATLNGSARCSIGEHDLSAQHVILREVTGLTVYRSWNAPWPVAAPTPRDRRPYHHAGLLRRRPRRPHPCARVAARGSARAAASLPTTPQRTRRPTRSTHRPARHHGHRRCAADSRRGVGDPVWQHILIATCHTIALIPSGALPPYRPSADLY
jgi:hypothetical protein